MTLIVPIAHDTNEFVQIDKASHTYYLYLETILKQRRDLKKIDLKQRESVTVIDIHSRIYCGASFLNARYLAILRSVIDWLLSNRSIAKNGVLSLLISS